MEKEQLRWWQFEDGDGNHHPTTNAGPSTPLRSAQDDTFWVNGGQRTTATAETTAASFGSAALRQDDIF
jgi:hypothetical protein